MKWALVTFAMMALLAWLVYCDYHDERRKEKAATPKTWTLDERQMTRIVQQALEQEREIRRLTKLLKDQGIPIQ